MRINVGISYEIKKILSTEYFNRINVALECLNGFVKPSTFLTSHERSCLEKKSNHDKLQKIKLFLICYNVVT